MAPRKTKTTAVEPQSEDVKLDVRTPEDAEKLGQGHAQLIINQTVAETQSEVRFQVALVMLPAVYPYIGDADHLDDENRAGATARIAFEFADAFIAQSKKGQGDGEG